MTEMAEKYRKIRELVGDDRSVESYLLTHAPEAVIALTFVPELNFVPGGGDFPIEGLSEKAQYFLGQMLYLKSNLAAFWNSGRSLNEGGSPPSTP